MLFTTLKTTLLAAAAVSAVSVPVARDAYNVADITERAPNSRWTWYDVETGSPSACGTMLVNSGFTVALNTFDFNPSLCGQTITLTLGTVTTTATIEDICPSCPPNALDLTPALFSFFSPLSAGIVIGDWV